MYLQYSIQLFIILFSLFLLANCNNFEKSEKENPRVIVTTDGEIDDRSSFIRFLLYTNDFDVGGIIATNSIWQKHGHGIGWIMDWCAASFSEANHPPIAKVTGELDRTVRPDNIIQLSAEGSTDSDGDNLSYRWWQYYEAGDAMTKITVSNPTSKNNASFLVPDEPGKKISYHFRSD